MTEASASIIVEAPPERVFAFMNTPVNQGEVTPSLIESREIGRMPNGGAHAAYTYKMAGLKLDGEVECTEFEQDRLLAFAMTGAIKGAIRQEFEPEGDGTRVTYSARYDLPMPALARLAAPLLSRYNQREIEALLRNLKDRVEAEGA